jgi:Uma2 family endonuclease
MPAGFWPGAPDLAVEIVSPDNRQREIRTKIDEYLRLGTELVWVVDPETKSITQYRRGAAPLVSALDDTLDGGQVIPGFQCDVRAVFEGL